MSNPDTTRIFNYPEVTTPASDAKILLDSQTVGSKCIDANLFRCDLIDKTITQRGTFEASEDNADGFKKVVVDIPYTDVHVASGPIATFEGEDLPLKSLTASIVPVQAGSGDPSPTNVRPISGRSAVNVMVVGENLYNIRESRYMSDANLQKLKSGDTLYVDTDFIATFRIFITYTGAENETGYTIYKNSITTIKLTNTVEVLRIAETVANNIIGNHKDVKIYHNGHTYTIPFTDGQGQSVEVFGGSVDVVNGGEQPNPLKKVVFDGSNDEDWRHYGGNRVTVAVDDFTSPASGVTANILCDKLKTITKSQQGGAEYVISGSDEGYHQFMVNVGISDITELRTWLSNNPITVVYELATPTTFYTQPTSIKSLDGVNNVFASTGDVDVEYQTVWVRPTE